MIRKEWLFATAAVAIVVMVVNSAFTGNVDSLGSSQSSNISGLFLRGGIGERLNQSHVLASRKVLLDCSFDMDVVYKANSYREPLHFFSEDDWAQMTGQRFPPYSNQHERIEALVGTVRVAKDFLDTRLNATWWVRSGMLIGLHRFGDILPWDTDVDFDMLIDDHVRLYHMVLKMPRMRNTSAVFGWTREPPFCNNTAGDMCVAAPLSPIHWVMSSKPANIETHNYKRAYARFIDIRTGHFSEIFGTIDDRENNELVTNVKWWWRPRVPREMILPVRYTQFRDIEVPIPQHPFVTMNGSFYETFIESHENRALIPMYLKDVKPGCVVVECTFPTSLIDPSIVKPTHSNASQIAQSLAFRHGRFAFEALRMNASNYIEVGRFFTSDQKILGEFNTTAAAANAETSGFCEPSSEHFVGAELHVDNERFCPECHQDLFTYKWS